MKSIDTAMRTLTTSLNDVKVNMTDTQKQLATNQRNLDATDIGIVVRIGSTVEKLNTIDSKLSIYRAAVDTSKAGLNQITSLVQSMKSLADEVATNTGLSAGDLANLQSQFLSFQNQIDVAVGTSAFDGFSFLSTTAGTQVIKVGLNATDTWTANKLNAGKTGLGIGTVSVSTAALAATALTALQAAVVTLGNYQQSIEKMRTSMDGFLTNNQAIVDTYKAASDDISKPDTAALQVQLNQLNDQQSINYYVISQINTEANAIMQIFR